MEGRIRIGLENVGQFIDCQYSKTDIRLMKDILRFIWERKNFILVPILLVLVVLAVLLVLGSATPVAPFVYSFF